ncbi:MAG: VirB8/TrbF family protein, partial [Rickettsiales bacterium]
IITGMAVVITFFSLFSLFALLPVQEVRPLVIEVENAMDKVGRVETLINTPDEDPNIALIRWHLKDYVKARESYDIKYQEQWNRRVWAQSEGATYKAYKDYHLGREGPRWRFEGHTRREVKVAGVRILGADRAQVDFLVTIRSDKANSEVRKSIWRADIAFRFTEIKVDQISGEVSPMEFKVTDYKSEKIG